MDDNWKVFKEFEELEELTKEELIFIIKSQEKTLEQQESILENISFSTNVIELFSLSYEFLNSLAIAVCGIMDFIFSRLFVYRLQ